MVQFNAHHKFYFRSFDNFKQIDDLTVSSLIMNLVEETTIMMMFVRCLIFYISGRCPACYLIFVWFNIMCV